jgi:hypothetical protein
MGTETPPPYFPQNKLSPSDEKARKKFMFTVGGCLVLLVLAVIGIIVGVVYWLK